jgi:diguanylate cyclase (GGDEF)-like protein
MGPKRRSTAARMPAIRLEETRVTSFELHAASAVVVADPVEHEERWSRINELAPPSGTLCSHRDFYERLDQEWSRATRFDMALAVVLIYVDQPAAITGDGSERLPESTLARLDEIIGSTCRQFDVSARLGADEFAYFLPHTSAEGAESLMKRLEGRIARAVEAGGLGAANIRLSYGIADREGDAETAMDLVRDADAAVCVRRGVHAVALTCAA